MAAVATSALLGGGAELLGTGYVNDSSPSSGATEDSKYSDVDVTSLSIADETKCWVIIQGGAWETGTSQLFNVTARLTSTTNLRVSTSVSIADSIAARYYIIQGK